MIKEQEIKDLLFNEYEKQIEEGIYLHSLLQSNLNDEDLKRKLAKNSGVIKGLNIAMDILNNK